MSESEARSAATPSRPRLLDLFCGAGGCSVGYERAGFDVTGVDIEEQLYHRGGEFVHEGALGYMERLLWRRAKFEEPIPFDAIHASPPCQKYSEGGRRYPERQALHSDLIAATRELVAQTGLPYVIENVQGAVAELRNSVRICARSVGLPQMARHRYFETNWGLMVPPCACGTKQGVTIGVYGDRPDGRELNSRYRGNARAPKGLAEAQAAMGMDWADWHGTKEAVPPAYAELIGAQLIAYVRQEVAA